MKTMQYHITREAPCLPHWPNGAWSVYQIDGDQIADRIVREEIVKPESGAPYYRGDVIARHSWCGFLGMTETFDGVRAMIEKAETVQVRKGKTA
jgi:hypothetical protein